MSSYMAYTVTTSTNLTYFKKKNPAVVANEAEALLVLAAVELSLKKMYNNVACLGGGPLYCTMVGGEDDEKP